MDEKLIDQFISDKVAEINEEIHTDVELVYQVLEQIWKIMALDNNEITSRLVEFLRFCTNATSVEPSATNKASDSLSSTEIQHEESATILSELTVLPSMSITPALAPEMPTERAIITTSPSDIYENTITSLRMSTSIVEHSQDQSAWFGSISLDQCEEANKYFNHLIHASNADIKKDQKFFVTAQEYSDYYWTDESDIEKYSECFDLIDQAKDIIDSFLTVQDLIHKLSGCNFKEGIVILEKLVAYHQYLNISESSEDLDSRLENACSWRAEFAQRVRENAEMRKANIVKIQDQVLEASNFLYRWVIKFSEVLFVNIFSTENILQYISVNITKQELAQQWLSPENVTKRQKFVVGITDLENKKKQYDDLLFFISDLMRDSYYDLKYYRPVIINDSSVHDLELVKKAMTVKYFSVQATKYNIISRITNNFYKVLDKGPMEIFEKTVMVPLRDIRDELKAFETNLKEYQDSIKMDSQFYL